jgi:hypothetical protein
MHLFELSDPHPEANSARVMATTATPRPSDAVREYGAARMGRRGYIIVTRSSRMGATEMGSGVATSCAMVLATFNKGRCGDEWVGSSVRSLDVLAGLGK